MSCEQDCAQKRSRCAGAVEQDSEFVAVAGRWLPRRLELFASTFLGFEELEALLFTSKSRRRFVLVFLETARRISIPYRAPQFRNDILHLAIKACKQSLYRIDLVKAAERHDNLPERNRDKFMQQLSDLIRNNSQTLRLLHLDDDLEDFEDPFSDKSVIAALGNCMQLQRFDWDFRPRHRYNLEVAIQISKYQQLQQLRLNGYLSRRHRECIAAMFGASTGVFSRSFKRSRKLSAGFPVLHTLRFFGITASVLGDIVPKVHLPSLRTIEVGYTLRDAEDQSESLAKLFSMKDLIDVDISVGFSVTATLTLPAAKTVCLQMPALVQLIAPEAMDLSFTCSERGELPLNLLPLVQNAPKLQRLTVRSQFADNDGIMVKEQPLCKAWREGACARLQTLELEAVLLSSLALRSLGSLPELEHLWICVNDPTSGDLLSCLKTLSRLRVLQLDTQWSRIIAEPEVCNEAKACANAERIALPRLEKLALGNRGRDKERLTKALGDAIERLDTPVIKLLRAPFVDAVFARMLALNDIKIVELDGNQIFSPDPVDLASASLFKPLVLRALSIDARLDSEAESAKLYFGALAKVSPDLRALCLNGTGVKLLHHVASLLIHSWPKLGYVQFAWEIGEETVEDVAAALADVLKQRPDLRAVVVPVSTTGDWELSPEGMFREENRLRSAVDRRVVLDHVRNCVCRSCRRCLEHVDEFGRNMSFFECLSLAECVCCAVTLCARITFGKC